MQAQIFFFLSADFDLEVAFEDRAEVEDVVEIFDGVGGLGGHPLMTDHQIDDLAEIACVVNAPSLEHHRRQTAPLLHGDIGQTPGQLLSGDVSRVVGVFVLTELFDGGRQAFINELQGACIIAAVVASDLFERFFHTRLRVLKRGRSVDALAGLCAGVGADEEDFAAAGA